MQCLCWKFGPLTFSYCFHTLLFGLFTLSHHTHIGCSDTDKGMAVGYSKYVETL